MLMLATAAVLGACASPVAAPPRPLPPVVSAPPPVEVVAFLRPEVTAAQKQAIAEAMRAEPGASGVRFMTADEAFEQLKRVYRETPGPESAPASYRMTLPDPAVAEAAAGRLRALPGVGEVRVGP